MRRYLALFAALSLMAFAGTAAAGLRGVPPQFPKLGAGFCAHAEINMKVKRHWHTVILDRGQVTQASPTQITLRECDGFVQTVELDDNTVVSGPGRAHLRLRRGLYAETMRIDGGPAVRVRVTLRP